MKTLHTPGDNPSSQWERLLSPAARLPIDAFSWRSEVIITVAKDKEFSTHVQLLSKGNVTVVSAIGLRSWDQNKNNFWLTTVLALNSIQARYLQENMPGPPLIWGLLSGSWILLIVFPTVIFIVLTVLTAHDEEMKEREAQRAALRSLYLPPFLVPSKTSRGCCSM